MLDISNFTLVLLHNINNDPVLKKNKDQLFNASEKK